MLLQMLVASACLPVLPCHPDQVLGTIYTQDEPNILLYESPWPSEAKHSLVCARGSLSNCTPKLKSFFEAYNVTTVLARGNTTAICLKGLRSLEPIRLCC